MKALVTGAAGFIGSHLSAALLDSGASVTGIDCFTDYYSRAIKEANLGTVKGRPGFSFVEAALQDVDLTALLAGVTHVFHLAGQAGVRKSWGGDFDVYIRDNIAGDSTPAGSARSDADPKIRVLLELVGLRQPRAAADARRLVFTAALPVRCDEAGRRASRQFVLRQSWRAGGVAALFHGVWAATAA